MRDADTQIVGTNMFDEPTNPGVTTKSMEGWNEEEVFEDDFEFTLLLYSSPMNCYISKEAYPNGSEAHPFYIPPPMTFEDCEDHTTIAILSPSMWLFSNSNDLSTMVVNNASLTSQGSWKLSLVLYSFVSVSKGAVSIIQQPGP
jgi:hypothetical protein